MARFTTPAAATIPTPERTIESILATSVALKEAVEQLQGARGASPVGRVFLQNTEPVGKNPGDLWIVQLPSLTMSYWTGAAWQLFVKAYPDGTLHVS